MLMQQPNTLHRQKPSRKENNDLNFGEWLLTLPSQAGLGRFFGAKFRAGVLYAIFEQSGDRTALELSLEMYQKARSYWAELAESCQGCLQTRHYHG